MITTIIFDTTPEVKQNIYMIVSQLNNAMMGSNENRDTLDEAMFRSWNNQKKEYQDEIQRLTKEVSSYHEELDKIQSKLLSGDMNARGISKNTIGMTIAMLTSYPGFASVECSRSTSSLNLRT
jgi:hypothetical protein